MYRQSLQEYKLLDRSVKALISISLLFVLVYLVNALVLSEQTLVYTMSISIGILCLLRWLTTSDNSPIVLVTLCWYLAIIVSYVAWRKSGVMDPILLAYCGILLIASMYSGRALMITLLCYMLASIYFLNYSAITGFTTFDIVIANQGWSKANNQAIFFLLYAFSLDLLSASNKARRFNIFARANRLAIQITQSNQLKKVNQNSGIPNGLACQEMLERMLKNKGATPALIYLRIDNFDNIASTQGEEQAKELINNLSKKIQKNSLLDTYHVSDRDLIILVDVEESDDIKPIIVSINNLMIRPVKLAIGSTNLNFSGGLAQAPFDGRNYASLRKKAVIALNTTMAKQAIAVYEVAMEERLLTTLSITEGLKNAIEKKEFELHYQPKIDLKTQKINGVEALIRWRRNGVIVPPDLFIGIAETTGFINTIGDWIIEQACTDCRLWNRGLSQVIPVAVNLSPVQFSSGSLPQFISKTLEKIQLPAYLLELELTESMEFNKAHKVEEQINTITNLGVTFSIDDFGSGYSNLAYISRFNAQTLKIDRAFVQDITTNTNNLHICKSIIQIANAFELKVVAEGVEDLDTGNLLRDLGVDTGQGYYWSRPLPLNDLLKFIET